MKPIRTKQKMPKQIALTVSARAVELWRLAAAHQGISRAELIRQGTTEKAGKILAGLDAAPVESTT